MERKGGMKSSVVILWWYLCTDIVAAYLCPISMMQLSVASVSVTSSAVRSSILLMRHGGKFASPSFACDLIEVHRTTSQTICIPIINHTMKDSFFVSSCQNVTMGRENAIYSVALSVSLPCADLQLKKLFLQVLFRQNKAGH